MRARERVCWSPVWGKEYEGYAANFYRANSWRCDNIHSLPDLMQDAYLIFANIKSKYPRVIEAKHFMALYKRAITNNMHDKAAYKHRKDAVDVHLSFDATEFLAGRIGEVTNSGYLAALLDEMPEELKLVLSTLANGLPPEKPEPRTRGLQPREGLSMQLRRLLRLPMKSDPLTAIKRFITT